MWMDYIARIIQDGIRKKQISRNAKPKQVASVFVSLVEGGIMLSRAIGPCTVV